MRTELNVIDNPGASRRSARPFLKWAGGKQRFLQQYASRLPRIQGRYIEPFLGGGSVFFHYNRIEERPFLSRLGDMNRALIRTYEAVRDDPDAVHAQLTALQAGYDAAHDKAAYYYDVRADFVGRQPRPDPGRFIFINRTCWNGLWRVNAKGQFNVPYGAPKSGTVIPSLLELRSAASALQASSLRITSWENLLPFAERGDFVFLDPPYLSDLVTMHDKYNARQFGRSDHERLADEVAHLAKRGVDFVLTNSGGPDSVELYRSRGLDVVTLRIPRAINSRTGERGAVEEIVVTARETSLGARTSSGVLELILFSEADLWNDQE